MAVVIETTLGDITVDLYLDQRPVTCLNFLKLCKMKYYNYNLFHTIRSGFIAQTGDPTGDGSGGQSIFGVLEGPEKRFFSGEKMPKIRHTDTGLLSMVGTGDMMVGSQFYFTLGSDLDSLDGIHCVIGEVTEGHEVLRKLNEVICDETHRPYQDVRITHTIILEDPFNDPPGLRAPSRSPSPSAERLKGGRIAPDEELDETQGKSSAEVQELIDEKEAKARATILEIVGDLPDADIAPPENVLFVCKLNPVTTDEDLEIIFSRFGKIVSCEVIRDKKSGDSLQYAFIEFDDKKSCEDAYLKMDNVLIDDRRIHVDFSQSVSKMKWLGKGRGVKYFNDDNSFDDYSNKDRKNRSRSRERDHNNHRNNRNNSERYISKRHENGERRREEKNRENRYDKDSREKSRRDRSRSRSKLQDSRVKPSLNDKNYKYSNIENSEKIDNNQKRKHNTYKQDDKQKEKQNYSKSNSLPNKHDKSELSQSSSRKRTDNSDMSSWQDRKNLYERYRNNEERKSYKESDRSKVENNTSKDKMHHKDTESQRDTKAEKSKKEYREPKTPPVTKEEKNVTKRKLKADKITKKEKNIKKGKKRKPSTSSSDSDSSDSTSSSSDSSSSNDSERIKKSIKRKKRKHSSSSSSSSESSSTSSSTSSDSSSSSSSSSDSESNKKNKRHKRNLKSKKPIKAKKKL